MSMDIRGMVKFSLVDYPGKIACVLFTGHCNFRCPFCHNPHLVFDPDSQPLIRDAQVFKFLESRQGKLEGVVISGGEPSLRKKEFPDFADKVRKLGYYIKMDSNGSNLEMIEGNWKADRIHALGIDYKAPVSKYEKICGIEGNGMGEKVLSTIRFAVKNNIQIDVRTTVHKSLLSVADLKIMRKELSDAGIKDWTLQQFHPVDVIDEKLKDQDSYSDHELFDIASSMNDTKVRGLKGILEAELMI